MTLDFKHVQTVQDEKNGTQHDFYTCEIPGGTLVKSVTFIANVVGYLQEQGKLKPTPQMNRLISESIVFIHVNNT